MMRTNLLLQVPLRPRLSANPGYSTRFETDADCFIPPNEPRKLFVASHGRMLTAHQGHEFERKQIIIREGKGSKDRCVPHPQKIIPKLKAQIERVVKLHEPDLESGAGWVRLPYALADKYPEAGRTLAWQFVFPAPNISRDSYPRLPTEGESGSEQVSKNDLTQLSPTTIRLAVQARLRFLSSNMEESG